MCPGLDESNSRLARVLDGQCLKFCDDTPSVETLHTLNNPQDLFYMQTTGSQFSGSVYSDEWERRPRAYIRLTYLLTYYCMRRATFTLSPSTKKYCVGLLLTVNNLTQFTRVAPN